MNQYICIHGHFYQPPRENPWLEEIEIQDSAYPYHDWNARITSECYAPNTASRILDGDTKIIDITNNYSRISFDFGPTLLLWLEKERPEIYKAIIEADKRGRERFSGHGPAIAQAYNHIIMPLSSSRDKRTQVIWGIKDFEHRFGRRPEGMWLPETAVDLESLDIMSENGIKFTILAPRQANRIRRMGEDDWTEVRESIDPKRPYLCNLPLGRSIAIFFYDGPIAHDIGFGDLLNNGEGFADRLLSAFSNENGENSEIVSIATDGETFGHHHPHGDMALAYCLYRIESGDQAKLTVFGEYLDNNPPEYEVEIFENSSWSCIHGVERWKSDCGCNTGGNGGWNQKWRAPLRGAMDWLRDNLDQIYEEQITPLVRDPWKTRDEYIEIILNRCSDNVEQFFARHAIKPLSEKDKIKILQLLEMERHEMLMYTSCAWFFDEISGIEGTQVLGYASRAIQLAKDVSGISLETAYINLLERAPSNIPSVGNGGEAYKMYVKPTMLDLIRVGVHFGVSSLFRDYQEISQLYTFTIQSNMFERLKIGVQTLATGMIDIKSNITWEKKELSFAILHLGDHNIVGGAGEYQGQEAYAEMNKTIKENFQKGDISEVIRAIDRYFNNHSYSLWHLFRDEQRKVLYQIFDQNLTDIENSFHQIYSHLSPILQGIENVKMPLPRHLAMVLEFQLETDIKRQLESDKINFEALHALVKEVRHWPLQLDKITLGFVAGRRINVLMEQWSRSLEDTVLMETVVQLHQAIDGLGLNLEIWESQNILFYSGKKHLELMKQKAEKGDENALKWLELFKELSNYQKVKID